jgi:hypothetical protein
MEEFVGGRRVEIDLNDVSMLNLQGTAQVILVCEGSKTSKVIKEALRRLYPSKGWRPAPECSVPRFSRELSPERWVCKRGVVASCEVRTSSNWAVESLPNGVAGMFSS